MWHIDGSFAVHNDMKSHTGIYMSTGKGAMYASSNKQKLVAKSSTKTEVIGVGDGIGLVGVRPTPWVTMPHPPG